MITIGRKWPKSAPRGDHQAICDYCGVQWRRSQLIRDRAGRLACPDDQAGRDIVTLSLANARGAESLQRGKSSVPADGNYDHEPAVAAPGPTFGAWVRNP